MAVLSEQLSRNLAWPLPFARLQPSLADDLYRHFAHHRPWFNDIIKLSQHAPTTTLTLHQWSQPAQFDDLITRYADSIYCNHPRQLRESKPLISLWAQWYLGLLLPPLVVAQLSYPQALNIDPQRIQVQFHESGRAASFWLDGQQDLAATALLPKQRLERLIIRGVIPVIAALEQNSAINAKLIWANTGYLINRVLGKMTDLLDINGLAVLRQFCFVEKQLSDGRDNPLYRTVITRDGAWVRRTCCQRYRLPDVQGCGDCTLKTCRG